MTDVSVLMPVEDSEDARRRELRDFVCQKWLDAFPNMELILGHTARGHYWSKGAAVSDAFARAKGKRLVIADADTFTNEQAIEEALEKVAETGWAVPHGTVYRLNANATNQALRGGELRLGATERQPYEGPAGGGIVVLTREAYETVNGIDPRFYGWGGEDVSFAVALTELVGPHYRVGAPLIHLQHPRPNRANRGSFSNEVLVKAYADAIGDKPAMRELVAREADPPGWAPPLNPPAIFRHSLGRAKRLRIHGQEVLFDKSGQLEVSCPIMADYLRRFRNVEEI